MISFELMLYCSTVDQFSGESKPITLPLDENQVFSVLDLSKLSLLFLVNTRTDTRTGCSEIRRSFLMPKREGKIWKNRKYEEYCLRSYLLFQYHLAIFIFTLQWCNLHHFHCYHHSPLSISDLFRWNIKCPLSDLSNLISPYSFSLLPKPPFTSCCCYVPFVLTSKYISIETPFVSAPRLSSIIFQH